MPDDFRCRIQEIGRWLEAEAEHDPKVRLLLTHKGIGCLSALAVVNALGDVPRFDSAKQVAAFAGFDPLE